MRRFLTLAWSCVGRKFIAGILICVTQHTDVSNIGDCPLCNLRGCIIDTVMGECFLWPPKPDSLHYLCFVTDLLTKSSHKENIYFVLWGLVTGPIQGAHFRAGNAADKIIKQAEALAVQEELENVRLKNEELKNVLHFKYLGAIHSGHGDPLVPVNHRIGVARS